MAVTNALSFHFNKFGPLQKDLIFQGAASSNNNDNVLQLTKLDSGGNPVSGSVGRVLHTVPLHLWGSSTAVSSFETTFTFSISSSNNNPADGLAFFIAPLDSQIPPNGNGSNLGIYPSDKVVAVEFDTYPNRDRGDPSYQHVGINVNSIVSKVNTEWGWQNGKIATAHISYNSVSKKLTAVTFYPGSKSVTLSYDIDLETVLPEWVRVGFSAATGEHAQTNTIISWSFTSSFINN